MDAAWNFINKIWNASRYVIMNLADDTKPVLPDESKWNLADRWILSKLNATIKQVNDQFEKFEFGEAGRAMYNFIWNDLCDWYIELTKETLNNGTDEEKSNTRDILAYVLDQTLRLIHPIMPFATEELWQSMPHSGKSIMVADYPTIHDELANPDAEVQMDRLIELITAVRNIRNEANAPLSKPVELLIKPANDEVAQIFANNQDYIQRFCNTSEIKLDASLTAPKLAMSAVITNAEVFIPMAELVDLAEERQRMEKEIAKLQKEVDRSAKKLANKKFVANAPEKVVNAEKQKAVEWQDKLAAAKDRLASLKNA